MACSPEANSEFRQASKIKPYAKIIDSLSHWLKQSYSRCFMESTLLHYGFHKVWVDNTLLFSNNFWFNGDHLNTQSCSKVTNKAGQSCYR